MQLQLFTASKSPFVRKRRLLGWLLFPGLLIAYAFVTFFLDEHDATTRFVAAFLSFIGLIWLIGYPFYSRYVYKRAYLRNLRDVYKNKPQIDYTLTFNENTVELKDDVAHTKLDLWAINHIYETALYYFLHIKDSKSYIIIPKEKISHVDEVWEQLTAITKKIHIPFSKELDWKWR
ncbi:hypothetical protein GCM10023231_31100 [Olivibacter ginsenosidimutans]|uniref:YcxB family protein n=1 Tax=Olivibacter ginsenosidimutans TaxID=1176537 RepID=A0ABP9BTI6_9SPHI